MSWPVWWCLTLVSVPCVQSIPTSLFAVSCWVFLQRSMLLILSGQWIQGILLRQLLTNICTLWRTVLVILHALISFWDCKAWFLFVVTGIIRIMKNWVNNGWIRLLIILQKSLCSLQRYQENASELKNVITNEMKKYIGFWVFQVTYPRSKRWHFCETAWSSKTFTKSYLTYFTTIGFSLQFCARYKQNLKKKNWQNTNVNDLCLH